MKRGVLRETHTLLFAIRGSLIGTVDKKRQGCTIGEPV